MIDMLEGRELPEGITHNEKARMFAQEPLYTMHDGLLMRILPTANSHTKGARFLVAVPASLRKTLLHAAHDHLLSGHCGIHKTIHSLSERFFWPSLQADVKKHVLTCRKCQERKKQAEKGAFDAQVITDEPLTSFAIDCVGPLPHTENGNMCILSVIDLASRYVQLVPLMTTSRS